MYISISLKYLEKTRITSNEIEGYESELAKRKEMESKRKT
jgi:hypothetical protein